MKRDPFDETLDKVEVLKLVEGMFNGLPEEMDLRDLHQLAIAFLVTVIKAHISLADEFDMDGSLAVLEAVIFTNDEIDREFPFLPEEAPKAANENDTIKIVH